ncbi:hypothetical protein [Planktotalea sp.]|mgnify:FL=1|uniref:hypothetical protein n=1 Tax=Planktotalea sp. TaxID=2029877 RepID=UPI0025EC7C21|nr:hypothetical protein [Planktotalea sp.]
MARSAFEAMGFDRARAADMVAVLDEMDRKVMVEVAPLHEMDTPLLENTEFIDTIRKMMPRYEAAVNKQTLKILQHNSKGEEQL